MSQKDFSNIGDFIQDTVQGAIDSMDFEQLNRAISDTVNQALEEARKQIGSSSSTSIKGGGEQQHSAYDTAHSARERRDAWDKHAQTGIPGQQNRTAQSRAVRAGDKRERAYRPQIAWQEAMQVKVSKTQPPAIRTNPKGQVAGVLCTVFGSIGLGVSGLGTLATIAALAMIQPGIAVSALILAGMLGLTSVFGVLLGIGVSMNGRLRRMRQYVKVVAGRSFCTIKELAQSTGRSQGQLVKDLKKIMQAGMIPDAKMDEKETCLMFTTEAYQQYLNAQESYKQRQLEEQERLRAEKEARGTWFDRLFKKNTPAQEPKEIYVESRVVEPEADEGDSKLRDMMATGEEYLRQMREANKEISGETISLKIENLEKITGQIFDTIRRYPEQIDEMEKFMEYYLPTTVKLVNAYREFERVITPGENIITAKKEIEKTLETIHGAFVRLLDDMYQDAAFDASTDASVLQTMLAQEGWTDSGMHSEEHAE